MTKIFLVSKEFAANWPKIGEGESFDKPPANLEISNFRCDAHYITITAYH